MREDFDQMSGEVFHWESSEVLEQAAQRGCGRPILGDVEGQAGWGLGQPDLVLDVAIGNPAWGRGVGTWWSLRILWFKLLQKGKELKSKIRYFRTVCLEQVGWTGLTPSYWEEACSDWNPPCTAKKKVKQNCHLL